MDATNMDVLLKDAPNHRGTERRGYGVGGNAKGPTAQPRQPNKGHIGYGSGENETELDVLYRALRGERGLQRMRATSHDRLTAETDEEREARKEGVANTHHDFCVRRGVVLHALLNQ